MSAPAYLVRLPSSLMDKHMLTYQIMMGQCRGLWQPGCPTTIQPRRRRPLTDLLIIEPHPVFLTILHQRLPAPKALWDRLLQHIENPNIRHGDGAFFRSGKDRRQHLRLRDQELGARGADVVDELEGHIGRVRAGEDAARGDDAEEEHRVLDIIEGVQAHTVAGL